MVKTVAFRPDWFLQHHCTEKCPTRNTDKRPLIAAYDMPAALIVVYYPNAGYCIDCLQELAAHEFRNTVRRRHEINILAEEHSAIGWALLQFVKTLYRADNITIDRSE